MVEWTRRSAGEAWPCRGCARFGALPASLLLGLVWAGWHLPLWFIPGQVEQSLLMFAISALMLSVVLAWLYNSTGGSLLIVVLAHSANNVTFKLFGQVKAVALTATHQSSLHLCFPWACSPVASLAHAVRAMRQSAGPRQQSRRGR